MTDAPSWSDVLKAQTRAAINDLNIMPRGDEVYFKHIRTGFGVISFGDLLAGHLQLRDSDTGVITTYADADALIDAGWAID